MFRDDTRTESRLQGPSVPELQGYADSRAKKSPHHWIIVFGRPGCGYTSGAVDALVRDGRFPFVYLSMPGSDRKAWWPFVQARVPGLVLPHTFPTVLVWEPNPIVLNSDGLKKYLSRKDLDPTKFESNFVRSKAAERVRTDDRSVPDLVRNGVDFVWQPE